PMRLLISRKLAEAVDRIARGTRCCTAVVTGDSHRMLTAFPISSSGHAIHRFGANKPMPQAGIETIQAIVGSLAYQLRSAEPSRSASQPPANTPAQPPTSRSEARKFPVVSRSSPKLRMITDGVHNARP